MEIWSAYGKLCDDMVDGMFVCDACAVCNGTWKDSYLTLGMNGVKAFLCSLLWSLLLGKATKDALVWCQEKTINAIFDRAQSSVRKYHVEAFFLTMITVKFIVLECRGRELYWVIGKDGLGVLDSYAKFERDTNWKGIPIYPDNTKWKHGGYLRSHKCIF